MDQCLSELDAAQRSTGRSTYDEVLRPQDVRRRHAAELDEAIEVLDSEHRVQLALQRRQLLAESEAAMREIRHAVEREHGTEMERLHQRHDKALGRAAKQHKQRLRKAALELKQARGQVEAGRASHTREMRGARQEARQQHDRAKRRLGLEVERLRKASKAELAKVVDRSTAKARSFRDESACAAL